MIANSTTRSLFKNPRVVVSLSLRMAIALFHSTPYLERQRRSRYKFYNYATRPTRKETKHICWDHVIHGFCNSENGFESYSECSSPFEKKFFTRGTRFYFWNQESEWTSYLNRKKRSVKSFWRDDDCDESDTIFGSAFGGDQNFHWYADSRDFFRISSSYSKHHSSSDWKDGSGNDRDPMSSEQTTERIELGLSISGPLKFEEVKQAYHSCALRWHPDRHQGSSKVMAEEKFKRCTAAYRALRDGLVKS